MAYTIIEVERKTGIPSRTLRFWADKGVFPYVEKDKNGVRYFSEKDLQWVIWVDCYRQIGMSIKDLKDYIALCVKGKSTAKERLEIILNLKEKTLEDMQKLQIILEKLNFKVNYYEKMIKENKDELNPSSKDYVKRKKRVKI
ncbi:TPA: MerR family transcriptional regulator [Campylobacter coli]|uniref:MerR family transcriptional regulator n=1 Tax=Campylobacter coli TaxID=195 RepID=UPI000577F4EB|nr:MerR family transcriptional regulator [Campylobacter coli]ECV9672078.1 MerR family transcriptional regulator [Campylobacter jejuni]EAI1510778.1 MerR family transcriptional regulator [Campylobacter coli]EBD1721045.1 MerR family transcriptional regulator [Campylobacter coli]ECL6415699.1 MerR family transcriptional regulator [Campylobacter coli]ECR3050102.1 MerR family transcriptional regulator [Campylobacter coli]